MVAVNGLHLPPLGRVFTGEGVQEVHGDLDR